MTAHLSQRAVDGPVAGLRSSGGISSFATGTPSSSRPPDEMQVTVLLPTYNGRRFIVDQIQSILGQNDVTVSLVILDDASSDDTAMQLERHFSDMPNVTILHNSRNRGQKECIQDLLGLVQTEFFSISDHDDVWDPDKLTKSLARLLASGADLVYSDLTMVDASLGRLGQTVFEYSNMRPIEGRRPYALLVRNPVHGCTLVGRRTMLGRSLPIPANIPTYDRWLALAGACGRGITCIREPLLLYRQHDSNLVGGLRFGFRGLKQNIRSGQANGQLGYLRARLESRLAMLDGIAGLHGRSTLDRALGLFFRSGRTVRLLFALPYFLAMSALAHELGVRNLIVDTACTIAAPKPFILAVPVPASPTNGG